MVTLDQKIPEGGIGFRCRICNRVTVFGPDELHQVTVTWADGVTLEWDTACPCPDRFNSPRRDGIPIPDDEDIRAKLRSLGILP